jgi:hypothetical protein
MKNRRKTSSPPMGSRGRRCFECAWCVPDSGIGPDANCRVFGRPLSPVDLWHKACADFSPIESEKALDPPREPDAGEEDAAPPSLWC